MTPQRLHLEAQAAPGSGHLVVSNMIRATSPSCPLHGDSVMCFGCLCLSASPTAFSSLDSRASFTDLTNFPHPCSVCLSVYLPICLSQVTGPTAALSLAQVSIPGPGSRVTWCRQHATPAAELPGGSFPSGDTIMGSFYWTWAEVITLMTSLSL